MRDKQLRGIVARWTRGMWPVGIVAGCAAVWATAGSSPAAVEIGQKAPEFSELAGVDGRNHSLADYAEAKAIVLVFTCNHCPVSQAYEDRLIALQKDFKEKGVQVLAVNPNCPQKVPEDNFENMQKRAAGNDLGNWRDTKEPFNFPYLVDATQEVARAYGATSTPHVFLLDQQRNVAYMGAIDDNMAPTYVKQPFVRRALEAVLNGNPPETPATTALGCMIVWK